VAERLAKDLRPPPDLRGAAPGMAWSLTSSPDTSRATRLVTRTIEPLLVLDRNRLAHGSPPSLTSMG